MSSATTKGQLKRREIYPVAIDLNPVRLISVIGNRHVPLAHAGALLTCVLPARNSQQNGVREIIYPRRQLPWSTRNQAHQFPCPMSTKKRHHIRLQMSTVLTSALNQFQALLKWDGSGTLEALHHIMVAATSDISQRRL